MAPLTVTNRSAKVARVDLDIADISVDEVEIAWGDDTDAETHSVDSLSNITHEYETPGIYEITIRHLGASGSRGAKKGEKEELNIWRAAFFAQPTGREAKRRGKAHERAVETAASTASTLAAAKEMPEPTAGGSATATRSTGTTTSR